MTSSLELEGVLRAQNDLHETLISCKRQYLLALRAGKNKRFFWLLLAGGTAELHISYTLSTRRNTLSDQHFTSLIKRDGDQNASIFS